MQCHTVQQHDLGRAFGDGYPFVVSALGIRCVAAPDTTLRGAGWANFLDRAHVGWLPRLRK